MAKGIKIYEYPVNAGTEKEFWNTSVLLPPGTHASFEIGSHRGSELILFRTRIEDIEMDLRDGHAG